LAGRGTRTDDDVLTVAQGLGGRDLMTPGFLDARSDDEVADGIGDPLGPRMGLTDPRRYAFDVQRFAPTAGQAAQHMLSNGHPCTVASLVAEHRAGHAG